MRANTERKSVDIEVRDINYILPPYVRTYLFLSKNEDPEKIIFPMFPSIAHPTKPRVMIPIEYVSPTDPVATEIAQDSSNIPEVTPEQEAKLDEKDEEVKRLKEELAIAQRATSEDLSQEEADRELEEDTVSSTPVPEDKLTSPAKAAFSVGSDQPPSDRQPKEAPGGDIGPGAHPSDMGSRDVRDQAQTAKDLAEGPSIEGTAEKPFEKTIKRDAEGRPVVEDMTDEEES